VRRRVFCASLADVFDAEVDDQWRVDLIFLIVETPQLDWLLLTKRPKVAADFFRRLEMVPPNVWLGTTVESQAMADLRIPILLSIPAKVRFLSCEPLLGPIDLRAIPRTQAEGFMRPLDGRFNRLDWVIAGGESGPKARPSHPDWFRSLRSQCQAAWRAVLLQAMGRVRRRRRVHRGPQRPPRLSR
jgi:protein gp37